MNLPAPAIIWINNGDVQTRVAAFTWQTPTGLAWLETGYLHDHATHAFHRIEGVVRFEPGSASVTGPSTTAVFLSQEEALADPDLCPEGLRKGLAEVQEEFSRLGLDWAAEFARMTQVLAESLGSA